LPHLWGMVSELSATGAIPASIVEAAAAGDTMAFARIVHAHHDDMVRVCQIITSDPHLAEDAVQSAWPLAWRRLRSLRDPGKLRPWLVTVAANEARQLLRRQHRERVTALEVADIGSHDGDPASRAADADLLAAIRLLSPDERALLSLRYVAGFDATEIGAALGMSASGVRSRLSRLIDRLRTEVGNG
jgi:RNA polymerase sigma factor (sigma-70 family)